MHAGFRSAFSTLRAQGSPGSDLLRHAIPTCDDWQEYYWRRGRTLRPVRGFRPPAPSRSLFQLFSAPRLSLDTSCSHAITCAVRSLVGSAGILFHIITRDAAASVLLAHRCARRARSAALGFDGFMPASILAGISRGRLIPSPHLCLPLIRIHPRLFC